jgi:hypothetical protein
MRKGRSGSEFIWPTGWGAPTVAYTRCTVDESNTTDAAWFAADEGSDWESIEIVDDLAWSDGVEECDGGLPADDPFLRFVGAIEQAACSFGASGQAISLLRGLLGVTRLDAVEIDAAARGALLNGGICSESPAGVARSERFTRQVLAWQDVLRETGEDFSACGTATLDEWSADLVARTLGGSTRPDAIRRELRKHGVAAFGLLAAA